MDKIIFATSNFKRGIEVSYIDIAGDNSQNTAYTFCGIEVVFDANLDDETVEIRTLDGRTIKRIESKRAFCQETALAVLEVKRALRKKTNDHNN